MNHHNFWPFVNFCMISVLALAVLMNLGINLYRLHLCRHCRIKDCCQQWPEGNPMQDCREKGCVMVRENEQNP